MGEDGVTQLSSRRVEGHATFSCSAEHPESQQWLSDPEALQKIMAALSA